MKMEMMMSLVSHFNIYMVKGGGGVRGGREGPSSFNKTSIQS